MPINYNPKDAAETIPSGDYDAELISVEDTTSKSSGKDMQVWTFKVFGPREITLKDYVVIPAAVFKIKQLAIALGKKEDFDAGNFQPEDYVGSGVIAEVIVESQDKFEDQNRIKKVKPSPMASTAPTRSPVSSEARANGQKPVGSPIGDKSEFNPDDIPF